MDSLLMQIGHLTVDTLYGRVGELVATQGKSEVIWSTHQHLFNLLGDLIIDVIETEI